MTPQEALWSGTFGNEYLRRNRVDWGKRVPFWRRIVKMTHIQSALEVGANAGWNLHALAACDVSTLVGLDINHEAVREATEAGLHVVHGTPELCDSISSKFDLVFTSGVLIHIGPEHLEQTMCSIIAASYRYVLAIEYAADHETEVNYRGMKEALWKRPYGELYGSLGLHSVAHGMVGEDDGFDSCEFWLMEKRA